MNKLKKIKKIKNSRNVEYQIARRRLTFVGRIIRMPNSKIPAILISATCKVNRPLGRPNFTIKNSILKDIERIIPTVDKYGSFLSYVYLAYDKMN